VGLLFLRVICPRILVNGFLSQKSIWLSASRRVSLNSRSESPQTCDYRTKACKYTVINFATEGGDLDRALRPGLAALRVAGYPVVCVCKRRKMPVYNIFTPLSFFDMSIIPERTDKTESASVCNRLAQLISYFLRDLTKTRSNNLISSKS